MKTSKLLQTLGLIVSIGATGTALYKAAPILAETGRNLGSQVYSKTPFVFENTKIDGTNYDEADQIVQLVDRNSPYLVTPETVGVINDIEGFDAGKAYDTNPNTAYNAAGYQAKFLGMDMGRHMTNIVDLSTQTKTVKN